MLQCTLTFCKQHFKWIFCARNSCMPQTDCHLLPERCEMTTDSPVGFVKSLELAQPRGIPLKSRIPSARVITGEAEQGLVDAGALASFTNKLSDTHKSDVLNSTLLAQLAVVKQFDRFEDTDKWYKYYVNVLGKVGWVIQEVTFEEYNTSGQTLKVSDSIIDILKAVLSGDELAVIQRTLDSLQSGQNEGWWVVFDRKSSGPCNEEVDKIGKRPLSPPERTGPLYTHQILEGFNKFA